MSQVTINGKNVPTSNLINHLFALGTRADEVDGGTFINSALKPFDVQVNTNDMTATSEELGKVRDWLADNKRAGYVVHIEDEGENKRTREITVGQMVKKIDAALLAMPYVIKARELARHADGGITKLDVTGEKTARGSSKSVSLDLDID